MLLARFAIAVSIAQTVVACDGPQGFTTEFGTMDLALQSDVGDTTYQLGNASFDISGTTDMTLTAEDTDQESLLEQDLPVGPYRITLEPGWQLFELTEQGPSAVDATLLTDIPIAFDIVEGAVTDVSFEFQVRGDDIALGASGSLRVGIGVAKQPARSVIVSELMINPAALADTEGEWIELRNVGTEPVDLNGCELERDGSGFAIDRSLIVAAGERVVLANGEDPGFPSDYVYSQLTLPNSSPFTLELLCAGELLDELGVDPSLWPVDAGVAVGLSEAVVTPEKNDDVRNWCAATTSYNGDLGTPGTVNPVCD